MSTTSIIMVTYHTGPSLWEAVAAALSQAECRELIVVNNGNPAEVELKLRLLARDEPRLTVISGQGNIGFARACNLGAKAATGAYLLLLNPDCLISPGAIPVLAKALESHPGAMLAGPYLANPDGSEQRGGRRNILTPRTALVESLGLHRFLKGEKRLNEHETAAPREVTQVEAISGAAMFLRREDYLKLGGMDERYFLHVEDMDFCLRVQHAGGKTIFVPEAKVMHYRSTSDVTTVFLEWQKAKGFIRYFYTHFSGEHSRAFLVLAALGILARFGVKSTRAMALDLLCKLRHNKPVTH